jgi:hypothetical protein
MSIPIDKITGPLLVAAVIGAVGILWNISIQLQGMRGEVDSLKSEIQQNRSVTCRFAKRLDIILGDCPQ